MKRKAVVFSSNVERVAASRETKSRLAESDSLYEIDITDTLLYIFNV